MVIITIPILAFMISGFGLGSPRAHRCAREKKLEMWHHSGSGVFICFLHIFFVVRLRHLDIHLIDCY